MINDKKSSGKHYSNSYTEVKWMGSGRSGTVHLVRHKGNNNLYIAKKISLEGLTEKEIKGALNEVST